MDTASFPVPAGGPGGSSKCVSEGAGSIYKMPRSLLGGSLHSEQRISQGARSSSAACVCRQRARVHGPLEIAHLLCVTTSCLISRREGCQKQAVAVFERLTSNLPNSQMFTGQPVPAEQAMQLAGAGSRSVLTEVRARDFLACECESAKVWSSSKAPRCPPLGVPSQSAARLSP